MSKIIQLVVLVFFMVVFALFFMYWLERLKIIPTTFVVNVSSRFLNKNNTPALSAQKALEDDDAFLLEKLRLQKQQEALDEKKADINLRESQIIAREAELAIREEKMAELENTIVEREKSLNQISKQFENKSTMLRYNVQALVNMPPDNAVSILTGYDDQTLIDTLAVADEMAQENNTNSPVPYWLSLLDAKRVAEVQQKLLYRN